MLILTREPDKTLKIHLADGVDPATPIGEMFAQGPVVLEDTRTAPLGQNEIQASKNSVVAAPTPEKTEHVGDHNPAPGRTSEQNPGHGVPATVKFSMHAAACQRIRSPGKSRRILGPAAQSSELTPEKPEPETGAA